MTDLRCRPTGLSLRSPIIAAASPVTADDDHVRALDEAGVGAIVLPSVFQEQLSPDRSLHWTRRLDEHNGGIDAVLARIERLAPALTAPVVASLNGIRPGGWTRAATRFENAGAAAVELSVSVVPTELEVSPGDVEDAVVAIAEDVVSRLQIPVIVKISPHVAAVGHLALRLSEAGVQGLVLFGRTSMPDIDPETGRTVAVLPLTSPDDLLVGLRWTAVLARRLDISLLTCGGIHSGTDVVKATQAGADAVEVASSLLRYGPDHVRVLRDGLARWMAAHDVDTLDEVRGVASLASSVDPAIVERAGWTESLVAASRVHAGRESLRSPVRSRWS